MRGIGYPLALALAIALLHCRGAGPEPRRRDSGTARKSEGPEPLDLPCPGLKEVGRWLVHTTEGRCRETRACLPDALYIYEKTPEGCRPLRRLYVQGHLYFADPSRDCLYFKSVHSGLIDFVEVRLPSGAQQKVASSLADVLPCTDKRRVAAVRKPPRAEAASDFELIVIDFPAGASPVIHSVATDPRYYRIDRDRFAWDQGCGRLRYLGFTSGHEVPRTFAVPSR